jgi:hypothetical protein
MRCQINGSVSSPTLADASSVTPAAVPHTSGQILIALDRDSVPPPEWNVSQREFPGISYPRKYTSGTPSGFTAIPNNLPN